MRKFLVITGQYGAGKNTYEDEFCKFLGIKKKVGMSTLLKASNNSKIIV
jgi:tRNA A37 threonylcarbamoyladenosine biosynthesis protein TsaE